MSLNQFIPFENNEYLPKKDSSKSSRLVILEDAIIHNIQAIRSKTNARIIAVIKENGYGTGLLNEYKILSRLNIDMFAVANSMDALILREEGATEDILVLTPVYDKEELLDLVTDNVVITVESLKQIDTLNKIKSETGITPRVHLKIDTGMGRYGFYYSDIPDLTRASAVLNIEGCYTHLAGGKNYKRSVSNQVRRFNKAILDLNFRGIFPKYVHVSNSRAFMTFGDLGFNTVRVGSALLGRTPSGGILKNSVWIESSVFEVINKPSGASIGYGSLVKLKKDSSLAIIKVGYGDGVGLKMVSNDYSFKTIFKDMLRSIKRHFVGSDFSITINGKSYPVVGKPGFSHLAVDVTDQDVNEGDKIRIRINPLLVNPDIQRVIIPSLCSLS